MTFTLINAYFKNAGMLARQYDCLANLPADLKARLQYIVCDDASPKGFRATPPAADLGLPVEIYRITRKTPWNWMAARNIAAHHAAGDWLLFTDMDHVLPEATLRRLVEGAQAASAGVSDSATENALEAATVYRFSRVDAPEDVFSRPIASLLEACTPYKPHPNSWLMTRDMYRAFGGFDERWAGAYGSDFDVRDRLAQAAGQVVMLDAPLVRYPRELIADASTTDFGRKDSEFSRAIAKKRARIAAEGGPPLIMSYPYKTVWPLPAPGLPSTLGSSPRESSEAARPNGRAT